MTAVLRLLALLVILMSLASGQAGEVMISEIFYHPESEDSREEFIEIHNSGDTAISLSGWRLTAGIDFSFPDVEFEPGAFVVISADPGVFAELHSEDVTVFGPWEGRLSNRSDTIRLRNAVGEIVDEVTYADGGAWGDRILGPATYGVRGWEWVSLADGGGSSLELISPNMPNSLGANWGDSIEGGTPGAANSIEDSGRLPLVASVLHRPSMPGPEDLVTIQAHVVNGDGISEVTVYYRRDLIRGEPWAEARMSAVASVPLDGHAGQVYEAQLPPMSDGTVVEFYVVATGIGGGKRFWPEPVMVDGGTLSQEANLLYQVNESAHEGTFPEYSIVMTAVEAAKLEAIMTGNLHQQTDAQVNATFVSQDPTGEEVRYLVGVRNRGHGSRLFRPNNFRINFPSDALWKGVIALNMNAVKSYVQHLGSILSNRAGVPAGASRPVRFFVNGVDRSLAGPFEQTFGMYAANEVLDSDFTDRMFHGDSSGNLYRGIKDIAPANFDYRGENPDPYRDSYFKRTNEGEDRWEDVIRLSDVLTNAADATYVEALEAVIHLDQWVRHLAFMSVISNTESGINMGVGDDYFLYSGVEDPRFWLVSYDLDENLGVALPHTERSIWSAGGIPALDRFLRHPQVSPRFLGAIRELINGDFAPDNFRALVERHLGSYVEESEREKLIAWVVARGNFLRPLVNRVFKVNVGLPSEGGRFVSPDRVLRLAGVYDAVESERVMINGVDADLVPWGGTWTAEVSLNRGINLVTVLAVGPGGEEVNRFRADVLFQPDEEFHRISGTLASDALWTAEGGPYLIESDLFVPHGVTLEIEAGTTVYLDENIRISVEGGTMLAMGTAEAPIRFSRKPGIEGYWQSLGFLQGSPGSKVYHALFEYAGRGAPNVGVSGGELELVNSEWRMIAPDSLGTLYLGKPNAVIRGCVFPETSSGQHIFGGSLSGSQSVLVEGNVFHSTQGYSDIIDFAGGRRPGPIMQVLNNVFLGGPDDALDIDNSDAHIEGNVFYNFRQDNVSTSTANGIATDAFSHVVAVRNIFVGSDHAVLLKNHATLDAWNNTFVSNGAVFSFGEPLRIVAPGDSLVMRDSIAWQNGPTILDLEDPNGDVVIDIRNTIFPELSEYPGVGNFLADPQFVSAETGDFSLKRTSPARGRGFGGRDLGALVPPGIVLDGLLCDNLPRGAVVLEVGGPGMFRYRYSTDGVSFGEERVIADDPFIQLTGQEPGLWVIGMNSAGIWQREEDAFHFVRAEARGLIISEVLAANSGTKLADGSTPDLVELFNDSENPIDLSGMRITDRVGDPDRFVFPEGASVAPGEFLLLAGDDVVRADAIALGFGLARDGDELYLLSREGDVVDSVVFGRQVAGYSLGRNDCNEWMLSLPSPAAPNVAAAVDDSSLISLNEWAPDSHLSPSGGFIELRNRSAYPAEVAGLALSFNPIVRNAAYVFPPLSFVGAGEAVVVDRLSGLDVDSRDWSGGDVLLVGTGGKLLDSIHFDHIPAGRSEGRLNDSTNGGLAILAPTPGRENISDGSAFEAWFLAFSLGATWGVDDSGSDRGADWNVSDIDFPASVEAPYVGDSVSNVYFEKRFEIPDELDLRSSRFIGAVKGGVIVYVNEVEVLRHNMPSGAVLYDTPADADLGLVRLDLQIPFAEFAAGANVLRVELHRSSGDSGVQFDAALAVYSEVNAPDWEPVRMSELLASNASYPLQGGAVATDWVELHNSSPMAVDFGSLSLTDTPGDLTKWVGNGGAGLPAQGRVVIALNEDGVPSGANTGFSVNRQGDFLWLGTADSEFRFRALDSVTFGPQVTDRSIGRLEDSLEWHLLIPTPTASNLAAAMNETPALFINEWMADPEQGDDWFEIHHRGELPADVSLVRLSDAGASTSLPPLSFIGGGEEGFLRVVADDDVAAGGNHVGFRLARSGDSVSIHSADGILLDHVEFGEQSAGISEGRFPDGCAIFGGLPVATPGASNEIDSDEDGIPDAWESLYGLDRLDASDAAKDRDGDRMRNLDEYLTGTNPADESSFFGLTGARRVDDLIVLTVAGRPGYEYWIESADDVSNPTWIRLETLGLQRVGGTGRSEAALEAGTGGFFRVVGMTFTE